MNFQRHDRYSCDLPQLYHRNWGLYAVDRVGAKILWTCGRVSKIYNIGNSGFCTSGRYYYIVREGVDGLECELAEIDENIVRNNPSPAEHLVLTARRGELYAQLAEQKAAEAPEEVSSQLGTKPQVGRPPEAASIRDQATKTGESKNKVHRSKQRAEKIGVEQAARLVGTSLDKGVELDALAQLPKEEQAELIDRAAAGQKVSARPAAPRCLAPAGVKTLRS